MKILATTLALIIAAAGVTFLGLFTWDELNEGTDATWTNYQACIETVTIEELKTIVFDSDEDDPSRLTQLWGDPEYVRLWTLAAQGFAIDSCVELRPPLTTYNG